MKKKYFYMAVDATIYELPIFVSDSVIGLARVLGLKPQTVSTYLCRPEMHTGGIKGYKVLKVENVEEEEQL